MKVILSQAEVVRALTQYLIGQGHGSAMPAVEGGGVLLHHESVQIVVSDRHTVLTGRLVSDRFNIEVEL